jgi:hexulose-6-phosphate isomerase
MPVTRRTFLVSTGAAMAAATLGATGRQTPPGIRKAVKFGMIKTDLSVEGKFRLLGDLGFDGVEMPSPADLDIDEVRAAAAMTGITVHGVVDAEHWKSPLSDPDPAVRARGRHALEQALRDCRRYGGDTVLLVPAVVNQRVSYADAWTRSQQEIRVVLPLAKELRVRIAIENVWNNFLLSPLEAARYIDSFDSPWIGWYFDVGNIVRYGWPDQWIRTLGKRIVKLDIKEYSRTKRDNEGLWKGFNVEIGDGDCDWPAVMAALRTIKYNGWATAEVAGGDADRLREIAGRMDSVLAS